MSGRDVDDADRKPLGQPDRRAVVIPIRMTEPQSIDSPRTEICENAVDPLDRAPVSRGAPRIDQPDFSARPPKNRRVAVPDVDEPNLELPFRDAARHRVGLGKEHAEADPSDQPNQGAAAGIPLQHSDEHRQTSVTDRQFDRPRTGDRQRRDPAFDRFGSDDHDIERDANRPTDQRTTEDRPGEAQQRHHPQQRQGDRRSDQRIEKPASPCEQTKVMSDQGGGCEHHERRRPLQADRLDDRPADDSAERRSFGLIAPQHRRPTRLVPVSRGDHQRRDSQKRQLRAEIVDRRRIPDRQRDRGAAQSLNAAAPPSAQPPPTGNGREQNGSHDRRTGAGHQRVEQDDDRREHSSTSPSPAAPTGQRQNRRTEQADMEPRDRQHVADSGVAKGRRDLRIEIGAKPDAESDRKPSRSPVDSVDQHLPRTVAQLRDPGRRR